MHKIKMSAKGGSAFGGKIKKEITKKTKTAPKKKVIAKVRTVSAVKKVVKKIKTADAPKRKIKKTKTIAAPIRSHKKSAILASLIKLGRTEIKFNLKRVTYMILALSVGILSAGFLLGLLEMVYLKNSLNAGVVPVAHKFLGMHLFLFPIVYVLIFGMGLLLGAWLGFWGWRVVYIERRHRMFRK